MSDCVFCKIVAGETDTTKVFEDDSFIGFLDTHPKAEGHTLIVPKKHFRNLLDIPSSLGGELLDAIKNVSLHLIDSGKGDGVNVVVNNEPVAGQVVFHAHVHVIPRKEGDGMKVIG